MPSRVESSRRFGTSPGRDRVVRSYRQLVGSASDEAAHQRMRRVEREFLDLVRLCARQGALTRVTRWQVLLLEAVRQEPTCTTDACLLDRTQAVHRVDQGEDTARFVLPMGLTPAAEERLLRATYAELAEKQELAALLEARKAARCAP